MHKIHHWAVRCLAATALVATLPASAGYLQFTYTNQDLTLTSHQTHGVPTSIDDFEPHVPSFSLAFTVPEKDLTLQPITTFFTRELNLSLYARIDHYLDFPILLSPSSYAQVSLNQDGQLTSWNLVAFAIDLSAQNPSDLTEEWVSVRSNSANGDQLIHRFHVTTIHRLHPIQGALLEFNYTDETSLSNWTVNKIPVPEPGLAGLLLSGLGVLLWRRRQDKSTRSNEKICLKSAN